MATLDLQISEKADSLVGAVKAHSDYTIQVSQWLCFAVCMCVVLTHNKSHQTKTGQLLILMRAHNGGDCSFIYYNAQAISGQAVDRHLLGLRLIALESGMETPDIFKDSAYSRSIHFCLSTSQVNIQYAGRL